MASSGKIVFVCFVAFASLVNCDPPPPAGAPAPGGAAPAPGGAVPAPGGAAPAPGGAVPAPGGAAPAPGGAVPAPGGAAPAPGGAAPPPGGAAPAPGGPPPPITAGANVFDVLGDAEKNKVCGIQAAGLCPAAGPADPICANLAAAVGLTSDACCEAVGVCKFTVTKPQQNPAKPGPCYLTVNQPAGYGVIFPCQNNPLIIGVPLANIK